MYAMTKSIRVRFPRACALSLALAACSSNAAAPPAATNAPSPASIAADSGANELPNACPVEGCKVAIVSAEKSGTEIALVFAANYTPDFERNHIHVFWDSQEPGAVSSDFQERGFTVQGKWHPTGDYPGYVTQSAASISPEIRGASTRICVTAAHSNHAVIDPTIFECRDVAELLK